MLMIYGASGFTGGLIARSALKSGLSPVLGGRSVAVRRLATELGLEARQFNPEAASSNLAGVTVMLNCAGSTARVLVEACIRKGVHYLDLAGEYPEHQALDTHDAQAKAAGVMLLPGVGFGVVPTDIAATRAASRLPKVERLVLAYETRGAPSRGTLKTVLPSLHLPGIQRQKSAWVPARAGRCHLIRRVNGRTVRMVANPWRADQVSAVRSTGAEHIETFSNFPLAARLLMRMGGSGFGRMLVPQAIAAAPEGPDEAARAAGGTIVWAMAEGGGRTSRVRIDGPDAYDFTAVTAVLCAVRAMAAPRPGLQTPSTAFGAALLDGLTGVIIRDEDDDHDHR